MSCRIANEHTELLLAIAKARGLLHAAIVASKTEDVMQCIHDAAEILRDAEEATHDL